MEAQRSSPRLDEDIARARGMTQLAEDTGITRDGLYKALSPTGNPSFSTVQKVIRTLGYKTGCGPSRPVIIVAFQTSNPDALLQNAMKKIRLVS
ncbi:addiction module antidote protein [Slackia exigua]|uniref:addiction module antidote protein n=1 Tax=Slackia exigua TaxID=84109 RepID=UPI003CFCCEC6